MDFHPPHFSKGPKLVMPVSTVRAARRSVCSCAWSMGGSFSFDTFWVREIWREI